MLHSQPSNHHSLQPPAHAKCSAGCGHGRPARCLPPSCDAPPDCAAAPPYPTRSSPRQARRPTPSARRRALAHPRPAAPARQATLRLIRPFPGPRRAPRRLPRAAISWCSGTTTPRTVRSQRPLVFRSIRPRGKASLVRCLGTSQGYQDALVLGVWEQVKDIKTLFML